MRCNILDLLGKIETEESPSNSGFFCLFLESLPLLSVFFCFGGGLQIMLLIFHQGMLSSTAKCFANE